MNRKLLNVFLLLFGLSLSAFGVIFFRGDNVKSIGGACIAIGAGLFSICFSNLWLIYFNKKHPQEFQKSTVEFNDERNTMIRNKAKAKAADIIQWFIMGIAYITISINAPMWVTLVIVGVFLLKQLLEFYFMSTYQKIL